jgi:hypothetical protein
MPPASFPFSGGGGRGLHSFRCRCWPLTCHAPSGSSFSNRRMQPRCPNWSRPAIARGGPCPFPPACPGDFSNQPQPRPNQRYPILPNQPLLLPISPQGGSSNPSTKHPQPLPSRTNWSRLPGRMKRFLPRLLGGVVAVLILLWAVGAMVASQMRGAEAAAVGVATATQS